MRNQKFPMMGAIIAIILLAIYLTTLAIMILKVVAAKGGAVVFDDSLGYVVTTIGGLISALVIAQLALTDPGPNPGANFAKNFVQSDGESPTVGIIANLYLAFWLISGLAALIIAVMVYPDANGTLSDIGTNWFGLAIAAGYSFFKLDPGP